MAVCMVFTIAAILPSSVKAEEIIVSEEDTAQLAGFAQQMIQQITTMPPEQMEEILKPSSILSGNNKILSSAVESYKTVTEELGEYRSTGDSTAEVSEDDIIVTTKITCVNGDGNAVLTLDREALTPVSLIFDTNAETTMGVKLETAALNTLIGLVTVFAMLVFLSFLISLFKHLNKIGGKGKKSDVDELEFEEPLMFSEPVQEEELVDDSELVAVIAAAIAASENTSIDGFVVRSIKKSNNRKWQRA